MTLLKKRQIFWQSFHNQVVDKFQKVLNAAARVICNSRKYDRGLTYTRRHELHWLDIPERIQFRTAVTVHRCLNSLAPAYLTELCTPITQSRSSCRLWSSYCNRLAVPSVKLSIGSRSFSVSGPTVWNALPDYLRNPTLSIDVFKHYLKNFFICSVLTRRYSALETLCLCAI